MHLSAKRICLFFIRSQLCTSKTLQKWGPADITSLTKLIRIGRRGLLATDWGLIEHRIGTFCSASNESIWGHTCIKLYNWDILYSTASNEIFWLNIIGWSDLAFLPIF